MASPFSARLAVLSRIFSNMSKISQCIQTIIDFKNDISAFASIPAVRTAGRNKQLPAEADMSVTTLAGLYYYFRTVCEHSSRFLLLDSLPVGPVLMPAFDSSGFRFVSLVSLGVSAPNFYEAYIDLP